MAFRYLANRIATHHDSYFSRNLTITFEMSICNALKFKEISFGTTIIKGIVAVSAVGKRLPSKSIWSGVFVCRVKNVSTQGHEMALDGFAIKYCERHERGQSQLNQLFPVA